MSTSQAGQELHCSCGNTLPIPTLRGLKELPRIEPADTVAKSANDGADERRPSILLGSLFAIIFVAVPTAIFFAYQRMNVDTSFTQEADQEQAFAHLDAASPQELSEAWDTYSTIPLGPPSKPPFYHVQRLARALEWRAAIACGVALLAAIAAATVAVLRRQSRDSRQPLQTHAGS